MRLLQSSRSGPQVDALPELTVARLVLLDEAIEARRKLGPDIAREADNMQRGTAIRDRIRTMLDELRTGEERLLATRRADLEQSLMYERIVQVAGTILSAVIVLIVFVRLRKEVQQRQQSTLFLDSILENIPHMVFVKTADKLRFARFNRAGEELLGAKREDLIGKSDRDLFPASQADHFQAKDREVLAAGGVADVVEEPIETPKGARWLHTKKLPILDEQRRPLFLLGISEDITERKALDDRLKALNIELGERVEKTSRSFNERKSGYVVKQTGEVNWACTVVFEGGTWNLTNGFPFKPITLVPGPTKMRMSSMGNGTTQQLCTVVGVNQTNSGSHVYPMGVELWTNRPTRFLYIEVID